MKKVLMFVMMFSIMLMSCSKEEAKTDEVVVWKFGHIFAEDNLVHQMALVFAEEVKTKTGGKIEVQVYPNSLEGNEIDNINGIRLGTSDITVSGESMQTWAPKAAMLAVPYTFQNIDHMKTAVEGEIGAEISLEIQEKIGLIPLAYILRLPRNLTSNKPITTPADLDKMILRVPNVPIFVKAWEALGAKPTPMALNEVFTSLQQGTIDGQENPLDLIYTSGFYEVQKYVNLTEHVYGWLYVLIGEKQFSKISPELQQQVMEAALIAQEFGVEELMKINIKYTDELKAKGVTFVSVDKKAFQDIVKPAMQEALNDDQKAIYEKILLIQ